MVRTDERPAGPVTFERRTIGERGSPDVREVTNEQIARYAAAIGASATRDAAPPLFVVVPAWFAAWRTMTRLLPGLARGGMIGLGMHESQDMLLGRPIRPGDVVTTTSDVVGLRAGAFGTRVFVRTESLDAGGAHLATQLSTSFFPGAAPREEIGTCSSWLDDPAPAMRGEGDVTASRRLPAGITRAYAEAANDRTPLHVDDAAARAVGLPGIVVHGMCLLAVVCDEMYATLGVDSRRPLERVAVRFAGPASPGTVPVTRFRRTDEGGVLFETTSPPVPLLRRGTIRLGPPLS